MLARFLLFLPTHLSEPGALTPRLGTLQIIPIASNAPTGPAAFLSSTITSSSKDYLSASATPRRKRRRLPRGRPRRRPTLPTRPRARGSARRSSPSVKPIFHSPTPSIIMLYTTASLLPPSSTSTHVRIVIHTHTLPSPPHISPSPFQLSLSIFF